MAFRIGIVGDLHTHWDELDVLHFRHNPYDLLMFTGDLGGGPPESSLRIARIMSRLDAPTLVMPGNNDTMDIAELAAELNHQRGISRLNVLRASGALDPNPPLALCGFSTHLISVDGMDVTIVAGRPHSMGGPELSFPEHMRATYGIPDMATATRRLVELVDASTTEALIFLSHNGPTGLGGAPHDMWGCDFKPGGGDWGDPDLAAAIDYAVRIGKRVIAVIAGHMHLRTKTGAERAWRTSQGDVEFINAARVPRIYGAHDHVVRHHVSLTLDRTGARVEEVFLRGEA